MKPDWRLRRRVQPTTRSTGSPWSPWHFLGASLLIAGGLVAAVPLVGAAASPAAEMAEAAQRFLASLDAKQRAEASFSLTDPHRLEWTYVPRSRKGVPIKRLTAAQRALAEALFKSGLGESGHFKARRIMQLEAVLGEMEKDPVRRDPEMYHVSLFGTPSAEGTWAWRLEGHHISLNVTIAQGTLFSSTPHFFGTNPAEVRIAGPRHGWRVLSREEDLGRQLAVSLDAGQRQKAFLSDTAPPEVLTGSESQVSPLAPAGLAVTALRPPQRALLRELLDEYTSWVSPVLARMRRQRLEKAGLDRLHFAWAGSLARGEGHYYRIQGPTFVVEFDNTQNDANHAHAVWRDFQGDFGRDLLREHLKTAHP